MKPLAFLALAMTAHAATDNFDNTKPGPLPTTWEGKWTGGEGFLDVIQRRDGDHCERTARIATRAGARTCFFSPELNLLILAVPERDGHQAELRVYRPE